MLRSTSFASQSFATGARRSAGRQIIRASAADIDPQEVTLRACAQLAVDKFVKNNSTVGLGHGPMVSFAVQYITQKTERGELKGVVGVPATDVAAKECALNGLPLTSFADVDKIDVVLEQVDELDKSTFSVIVGRAAEPVQPQIMRSRCVAEKAVTYVAMVASPSGVKEGFSGTLPVVIEDASWEETAEELDDIFLGDAELWRRGTQPNANPRGGEAPYVSPDGHNLIDIRFDEGPFVLYGEPVPLEALQTEIMAVPGLVTTGMFIGAAHVAVVAAEEPAVIERKDKAQI